MDKDKIEKRTTLRAPLARVWSAVSDAKQFGAWFGVEFETAFVAGQPCIGRVKMKESSAYDGMRFEIVVDRIEPMRLFSFRWHPYAVDPEQDYSGEPMTLVTFELAETSAGTQLVITESGFDRIPAARRAKAFEMNTAGWATQIGRIASYVHA